MEDTEYMDEGAAKAEIDEVMMNPEHPYHSKTDIRHGDAVGRMEKLYQRLWPEPEPEPDGPAVKPSKEIVDAMADGLAIREKKVETEKEEEDARLSYLLELNETGDTHKLVEELKIDLTKMGASGRDMQLVDYLNEIVTTTDNQELRDWCEEFICWVYQINKGEK